MRGAQAVKGFLVALSTIGTWACADRSPTGSEPVRVSAAMTAAEERQLKQVEEQEKRRIAAEQERSKRAYDSLKVEWARLNKKYPNGNPELLYCDPIQYAATVKIVGPEGADLDFGPHKLSVPRGALTKHVVITAEAPVSLLVESKFSPHGTQFVRMPKLTLSYKHCNRPTSFQEHVAYIDDADRILEWPTSADRTNDALVDAWIKHFSGYAVAYRSSRTR